ncbi:Pv-fam-d protein [Plasmodium malariae]|uniref:Pv-fam-d protein n=1 Tax=Plasmodium malariae TaxID=5858 RepID=A0A1A8X779_PLAMA|nr:Pv-fam-d protein [Plasmodium malariae]
MTKKKYNSTIIESYQRSYQIDRNSIIKKDSEDLKKYHMEDKTNKIFFIFIKVITVVLICSSNYDDEATNDGKSWFKKTNLNNELNVRCNRKLTEGISDIEKRYEYINEQLERLLKYDDNSLLKNLKRLKNNSTFKNESCESLENDHFKDSYNNKSMNKDNLENRHILDNNNKKSSKTSKYYGKYDDISSEFLKYKKISDDEFNKSKSGDQFKEGISVMGKNNIKLVNQDNALRYYKEFKNQKGKSKMDNDFENKFKRTKHNEDDDTEDYEFRHNDNSVWEVEPLKHYDEFKSQVDESKFDEDFKNQFGEKKHKENVKNLSYNFENNDEFGSEFDTLNDNENSKKQFDEFKYSLDDIRNHNELIENGSSPKTLDESQCDIDFSAEYKTIMKHANDDDKRHDAVNYYKEFKKEVDNSILEEGFKNNVGRIRPDNKDNIQLNKHKSNDNDKNQPNKSKTYDNEENGSNNSQFNDNDRNKYNKPQTDNTINRQCDRLRDDINYEDGIDASEADSEKPSTELKKDDVSEKRYEALECTETDFNDLYDSLKYEDGELENLQSTLKNYNNSDKQPDHLMKSAKLKNEGKTVKTSDHLNSPKRSGNSYNIIIRGDTKRGKRIKEPMYEEDKNCKFKKKKKILVLRAYDFIKKLDSNFELQFIYLLKRHKPSDLFLVKGETGITKILYYLSKYKIIIPIFVLPFVAGAPLVTGNKELAFGLICVLIVILIYYNIKLLKCHRIKRILKKFSKSNNFKI